MIELKSLAKESRMMSRMEGAMKDSTEAERKKLTLGMKKEMEVRKNVYLVSEVVQAAPPR